MIPVGNYLEHKIPLELAELFCEKEAKINVVNVHQRMKEKGIDTAFNTIFKKIENKLKVSARETTIDAPSPTRLLSAMKDIQDCDLMIMGMPRKSFLKAMYKGSFKRTLDKVDGSTVIIAASAYERVYKKLV